MIRWQISFNTFEAEALSKLAVTELREPRDQVRVLVREGLIRLGMLDEIKIISKKEERKDHEL
jgi:hypothetical protein